MHVPETFGHHDIFDNITEYLNLKFVECFGLFLKAIFFWGSPPRMRLGKKKSYFFFTTESKGDQILEAVERACN